MTLDLGIPSRSLKRCVNSEGIIVELLSPLHIVVVQVLGTNCFFVNFGWEPSRRERNSDAKNAKIIAFPDYGMIICVQEHTCVFEKIWRVGNAPGRSSQARPEPLRAGAVSNRVLPNTAFFPVTLPLRIPLSRGHLVQIIFIFIHPGGMT